MNRFPGGWWIAPAAVLGLVMWLGIIGLVLAEPYTVQWTQPVDRADGAPLSLSDIYAYFVAIDGNVLTIAYGDAATFDLTGTVYADGNPHVATVRTIDTGFRISVDSNSVIIPVPGPSAPVITCQP